MGTYKEEFAFNFFVDDPKEIKQGTQRMVRVLMDYIAESNFTAINELLQAGKQMRYSIQGYEEDVNTSEEIKTMLTSAGYTSALLDAMQLYVDKANAQNEILKVKTKYRDAVLRALAKRGTLLHGDLASVISVSPSQLNAIIKQMNETSVKLVNVEEISKYKLYSITPVAYKYIMKQEQEYLPRKDKKLPAWKSREYVVPASRYNEQEFTIELYIDKTENVKRKELEVVKRLSRVTPKYSENVVSTQILPYKKKLA